MHAQPLSWTYLCTIRCLRNKHMYCHCLRNKPIHCCCSLCCRWANYLWFCAPHEVWPMDWPCFMKNVTFWSYLTSARYIIIMFVKVWLNCVFELTYCQTGELGVWGLNQFSMPRQSDCQEYDLREGPLPGQLDYSMAIRLPGDVQPAGTTCAGSLQTCRELFR
jgi:hypothetical protein